VRVQEINKLELKINVGGFRGTVGRSLSVGGAKNANVRIVYLTVRSCHPTGTRWASPSSKLNVGKMVREICRRLRGGAAAYARAARGGIFR